MGGDPAHGDVYGLASYDHVTGAGVLCVRNPAYITAAHTFAIDDLLETGDGVISDFEPASYACSAHAVLVHTSLIAGGPGLGGQFAAGAFDRRHRAGMARSTWSG